MRKTKSFKIDGFDQQISVKELTVRQILSLIEDDTLTDTSLDTLRGLFQDKFLPLCVEGITMNDMLDFAPSEILEIWDHFAEVNKAFFVVARKSGLLKSLDELREAVFTDFSKLLVDSSNQDTSES